MFGDGQKYKGLTLDDLAITLVKATDEINGHDPRGLLDGGIGAAMEVNGAMRELFERHDSDAEAVAKHSGFAFLLPKLAHVARDCADLSGSVAAALRDVYINDLTDALLRVVRPEKDARRYPFARYER